MLDYLQSCLKKEFEFSHFGGLINNIGNIIAIVQTQYTKDTERKNAAIDVICQILQKYKQETTTVFKDQAE